MCSMITGRRKPRFFLDLAGTPQSVFFLHPLSFTVTCQRYTRSLHLRAEVKQCLYHCNTLCKACTTPPKTPSLTSDRNSSERYSGVSRRLGGSTWFCRTWPTAAVKGGHVLAADWRGAKRYSVPKKSHSTAADHPPQLARTKKRQSVRSRLCANNTFMSDHMASSPHDFYGVAHGSSEVLFGMQCWCCLCENFLMSVHMGFCHRKMLWSV